MTGVSITQWRGNIGMFNFSFNFRQKLSLRFNRNSITSPNSLVGIFVIFLQSVKAFTILFSFCSFFAVIFFTLILSSFTIESLVQLLDLKALFYPNGSSNKFLSALSIVVILPTKISKTLKIIISSIIDAPIFIKNLSFFFFTIQIILIISGLEINPGPSATQNKFSFGVWNVDSLPARDFSRIPLIEALQDSHSFDIFGICESLLSNEIDNDKIFINGFSPEIFRSDKPANIRNGGVCLYYNENLPIKERRDLEILPETIVAEINLHKKKDFLYT